ncbi:MAG: selenide, water dikinase SelD, partial [Ignavibacteria bacterium]|nr:selenide, water dikinase SelD [Ignavibacteria bacterium]
MDKVRLTQMVTSAGCAAKIFPYILNDALQSIKLWQDGNVIVGFGGNDDAGIYRLNDTLALIQTTDFFTPVVDDPFTYGMIAAANSLSDVYAMGGKPINAMNIISFPQKEDINILKEILAGGAEKAKEAECCILGGHSVDIPNILYGMAVTGTINPKDIKGNNTSKPGDTLILTKALGTGVLNNSIKYSNPEQKHIDGLISSMTRLNRNASTSMIKYNANGCTDVTGFGLAGHAMQMAKASGVVFNFNITDLPVLEGAKWAISQNFLTRGDKSNRIYAKDFVITKGEADLTMEHLFYDPQTSGGLLISVPESEANSLLRELKDNGDEFSSIVGYVTESDIELKPGTLVM